MRFRRHFTSLFVGFAATALLSVVGAHAQNALQKVNVGVSTLSTDWLPIFVADKRGFFKAEGLDATVTAFQSGTQAFAALSGGDLDLVGGAANRGVIARDKGLDIIAVLAVNDGYFFKLMVTNRNPSQIKSMADLKGKRIAVKPGALSETLLKFVLSKNGLKASDVEIVGVPNEATELALVQRAEVDAVMTGEPTATIYAHRSLAKPLVDFADIEQLKTLKWEWLVPTHILTVMSHSDFLKKRPDVARAALRAIQHALEAVHKDPDIAVKTWLEMNPSESNHGVVRDSVRALVPGWSKDGRLLKAGMDNLQELLIGAEMTKKALPFDLVATNDYLSK